MASMAAYPFIQSSMDPGEILLDYDKLADLADVFEPVEFPRMLMMAELNVVALLDQIDASIKCAEPRSAGKFVHTLGGLLGTYGMKTAARCVCQIETGIEELSEARLQEFVVLVNQSLEAYRAFRCRAEYAISGHAAITG